MQPDLDKINTLLDKLTIDTVTLMEMHIQAKLDLEAVMSGGEAGLAKARYIMGQRSVSTIQLPNEESDEFDALARVELNEDGFDLQMAKAKDANPIRWFGVLVPQALYGAQDSFRRAVDLSVKCANVQRQLVETMDSVEKLRAVKKGLVAEE